jgi:hypothetical protein
MKNGEIRLAEIGTVEPFVRKVLLGWIGKSMAAKNHEVKTDYGMTVKVAMNPDHLITLDAEDGKLIMPDVVFERSGGER